MVGKQLLAFGVQSGTTPHMPCTCGNPGSFDRCCGPYIEGKPAPTAQALMRARYSAYVQGKIDFVYESLAKTARADFDRDGALQWSRQSKWLGLEIKQCTAGGPDDESGTVEFVARFEISGEAHEHHEIATFTKEDGRWCFLDGKAPKQEPFRRNTAKVGPNEPCPCGSGKKHKKCCAKK